MQSLEVDFANPLGWASLGRTADPMVVPITPTLPTLKTRLGLRAEARRSLLSGSPIPSVAHVGLSPADLKPDRGRHPNAATFGGACLSFLRGR
jgi:hypothetical protein